MTTGDVRQSERDYEDRGSRPLSQEAYAMLSTANLLRIRGLWPEAIEKCMIAMQLSPGHAAAQSLLGDIYENMGQTHDAIRWYQMALDANPISIADRNKLDRLVAARLAEGTVVDTTITGAILAQPPEAAPAAAALGLRIAAIVSTVAVVLVVGYALAQTPHRMRTAPASQAPNISTDPILLNQNGGSLSDNTTGVVRDTAEQNLLQSLQGAVTPAVGARIVDAQSDPRSGRITVSMLAIQSDATPVAREPILRAALVAALALQHSTMTIGYSDWTVRYLVQPQGATPTISFIGDSSRAGLALAPSDPTAMTGAQIEALFSNEWWSPTIPAPAPPAG